MDEIWKDITGYEGYYQVSNKSRVRSLDRIDCIGRNKIGVVLKDGKDKGGYRLISLNRDGKAKTFKLHRLIAFAFIENSNPEKFNIIDHKNGIRDDNSIENLRWVDSR